MLLHAADHGKLQIPEDFKNALDQYTQTRLGVHLSLITNSQSILDEIRRLWFLQKIIYRSSFITFSPAQAQGLQPFTSLCLRPFRVLAQRPERRRKSLSPLVSPHPHATEL
jgi:hypothetical protein